MRRLPIFFVLDVSESMIGRPIQEVEAGLNALVKSLRQDPYALETAYLSVIAFAGRAKTLTPLTDIVSFQTPKLPIGGGTSLGAAIRHLLKELDTRLVRNDGTRKGDWKPIVFLFTDGVPTDEPDADLREWERTRRDSTNLIAVSVGDNADLKTLRRLTNQVLVLNDAPPEAFREFFKWITASVATSSRKVETTGDDKFDMGKLDDRYAKMPPTDGPKRKHLLDDNFVVLRAKCGKTDAPYLIKFRKHPAADEWPEFLEDSAFARNIKPFRGPTYILEGAFPLPSPNEYAELSASEAGYTVNSNELDGNPNCPCCGNRYGFANCSCGGIHCVSGTGSNRCSWCGKMGTYVMGGDDDNDLLSRGLG